MCGVIGYAGPGADPRMFFNALKRLEYRGYDSAGIAMQDNNGITIVRAEGKLNNLETKLPQLPQKTQAGIGHTRWATHGKPSETNAHPHRSENIVLLHNGIIENYKALKGFLVKNGYQIQSETDTEIAAHLLHYEYKILENIAEPLQRMRSALLNFVKKLEGTFAFGILCVDIPNTLFCVKYGSPLVVGLGKNENYIASGITALVEHTNEVIILEDKEIGILQADNIQLFDFAGQEFKRAPLKINWSVGMLEKGGYRHFMLKEIHEQPDAVAQTVINKINRETGLVDFKLKNIDLKKINRIQIIACGTSYYSGILARYYLEQFTKLPVEVELASESRYRTSTVNAQTLAIAVSQSGETIDTLQAIKNLKKHGAKTLAIVNVQGSTISYSCDEECLIYAGPEVAVASTKAFSAQVSCFIALGLAIAQEQHTLPVETIQKHIDDLIKIPSLIEKTLTLSQKLETLSHKYALYKNILFIGRGPQSAVAFEGALKLKELSYIHAEAYAAGELKHGPIALIDENMPVVCLAPRDEYYEKTISNIEEIRARGGKILSIGNEDDHELMSISDDFIGVPSCSNLILPFVTTIPMHLFAYWVAIHKGTDVDQPRNLAKSVTVE